MLAYPRSARHVRDVRGSWPTRSSLTSLSCSWCTENEQAGRGVPRGGQAEPVVRVTYTTERPRGIIHFIGGAVVGAAPQATYPGFISDLANGGYTVVSTAYPFTFLHRDLAYSLHQSFTECVEQLRARGQGALVPQDAPMHGVGHSNGAHMHLLIGALLQPPLTSNVLLSYNNKEVSDAIPIPGFIESVRPALQDGRENGRALPDPEGVRAACREAFAQAPLEVQENAGTVLAQLSSCLLEIEDGTVDFTPPPGECRALIGSQYRVPVNLLLGFRDDGIDETPEMARILRRNPACRVFDRYLPGTHATPCGGTALEQVAELPADLAVAARTIFELASRRELSQTSRTVLEWLQRFP